MWVVGQDLKAPPRCTGPECAERVRVKERTPRRRVQRQAETQVDQYGRPKPRLRAERYRFSPPSPRHKALERAEAFTPYAPAVRHSLRAERQRLRASRRSGRVTLRAERQRPPNPTHAHRNRAEKFALRTPKNRQYSLHRAEKQKPPKAYAAHRLRAESYRPPSSRLRHQPKQAEKWVFPFPPLTHRHLAEKHRYAPPSTRHRPYPERWAYEAPKTRHRRTSERFGLSFPAPRHRPAPEKELYAMPGPRHKATRQNPCGPPPLAHPSEKASTLLSCLPPPLRHAQKHQQAACERPSVPHAQRHQSAACQLKPLRHRQNMQVASCRPAPLAHSQTHQKRACSPPPISHSQAYQRTGCKAPTIPHRLPENYTVPCDAQRRGVMTQTQRFAYDLRYLFTNHRKHCQVQSAYSGVSIGEWVNTEAYGRVPVVAYKMGWRVYHFAHFYNKKGRWLKKPRIEKRKVRALYQIQVLVPQPATGKSKKRRYIKGLPGIEGFGGMADMVLERKWLSPEETKAIQIEKLVRKRQIAWLVRAYPEEQVRLPEWLQKYAGPKPEHLWPGVDYRLLEVWQ
jgi:hypothetical protein